MILLNMYKYESFFFLISSAIIFKGVYPVETLHAVAADGVIDLKIVTPAINPQMSVIFRISYCPVGDTKNCRSVEIARSGQATVESCSL